MSSTFLDASRLLRAARRHQDVHKHETLNSGPNLFLHAYPAAMWFIRAAMQARSSDQLCAPDFSEILLTTLPMSDVHELRGGAHHKPKHHVSQPPRARAPWVYYHSMRCFPPGIRPRPVRGDVSECSSSSLNRSSQA